MATEAVAVAVEWAVSAGPPNWVFLVAVLTQPAVWSKSAVGAIRRRLGKPSKESGA